MGARDWKSDQLSFVECRRINDEIVEVLSARPCVVGDDNVSGFETILAELRDAVGDRRIEIAHEQRQPAGRLRDEPRVGIKNAGGKRGPLLHSFRHGFAVQRLLAWYADNLDVRAMVPHLSVYLGHLSKEETYWYLTATPELLTAAGDAFRRSCEPGGDS